MSLLIHYDRARCSRGYVFAALITLVLCVRPANAGPSSGSVVVGDARFTVITRNLIRMEFAPGGQFVDAQSIFAVNRSARYSQFKVATSANSTTIDTGSIRLTYTPDGKPFGPANLSADIVAAGQEATHWTPGTSDSQNLGGTIRTLDGVKGPVGLGQGIISRSGWALIDDSRSPLLTADWVQSRPNQANIDWYLFGYGLDFHSALTSYTSISGFVPLPRRYTLGAWYSRYWPYSSADYRQIVDEFSAHDFPLDNIVLDMDWHKDGWTGWSWNRVLLPDAEDLLKWFHDQGLRVTVNLHPADGVAPHEDQYEAFMKALGQDPASKKTIPFDAGCKPYMDALTSTVLDPLTKEGVDFWWLDWQQYANTRSVPDLTNLFWLNTLLSQQTSQDNLRGQSFSRWGGFGDQRHPIHFSGDANTGFPMLAFEPVFTAAAGNVGCFFWSNDIGGHMGGRNEESYARWCQFGATSPVLRSHSTRSKEMDRRPWTYSKWAEDSMRTSFHLRSELFPYIYTSAQEACSRTTPLDRPLYIDYPTVESSYHNAQEYLLGDNLLAAPVATAGVGAGHVAAQTVWLPPGSTWFNWFTGERIEGGSDVLTTSDIDEFPLYARGGVPIPMQPYTQRMATAPLRVLVLRCYPGDDGATGRSYLYEDDGVTRAYQKGEAAYTSLSYLYHAGGVTITMDPAKGAYAGQPGQRAYRIVLPDTRKPVSVRANGTPASWTYDSATFTTTIDIPAVSIRKRIVVTVDATGDGWTTMRQISIARRLAAIMGHPVTDYTLGNVLRSADYAALDASSQQAVLATFGLGQDLHNDGAIMYKGALNRHAYVPAGLVDGDRLSVDLDGSKDSIPPYYLTGRFALPSFVGVAHMRGAAQGAKFDVAYSSFPLDESDLARSAKITVSSSQKGYYSTGLNDGVLGGYPSDNSAEWASDGQKAGAWARLDWKSAQTIDLIAIFDRPNLIDQVTSGEVEFSDGSKMTFGELPNDGQTPLVLRFPSKTVTWFKVIVTSVLAGTQNAGFSEIAAYNTRKS